MLIRFSASLRRWLRARFTESSASFGQRGLAHWGGRSEIAAKPGEQVCDIGRFESLR